MCNRRSVASSSWSREIDHCPWCNKDLAVRRVGGSPSFAHLARRHDERTDMFCSEVLGEFVARTSTIQAPASHCEVNKVINSAVDHGIASSEAALASMAGLSKSTLATVKRGVNRPSLVLLLRLAAAADVSLAGVFYSQLWRERARGLAPAEMAALPRLRVNRKHDWNQIRQDAQAALERGEAISLQRLARNLSLDQSYLAGKIGDMRGAILDRGREARAAERLARLAEMTETVRRTRDSLIAQGARATARAIGRALDRPTRSPYMRHALKLARA